MVGPAAVSCASLFALALAESARVRGGRQFDTRSLGGGSVGGSVGGDDDGDDDWKALCAVCRDGAVRLMTQSVSVFYPMTQ